MTYLQNIHTHCTYCDGKDTPEQIVKKAIEIGFDAIGFSSHAPFDFDTDYTLTKERIPDYVSEIKALKNKYKDRIDIYCGLESDYFSTESENLNLDYKIGSVHLLEIDGKYYDVDYSLDMTKKVISEHFNGDAIEYSKHYYSLVSKLADVKRFDIVGHIDLITKFNDKERLIDEDSKEYQKAALEAIHSLKGKAIAFEVNTGAISRKHRTIPYPAPFILKELHSIGEKIILTSDCHNKEYLNVGYSDAIELIKECGFKSIVIKTNGEFEEVPID